MAYPRAFYNPQQLRAMLDEREARKMYTELRNLAQKRLKRIRSSEWAGTEYDLYSGQPIPMLRDITTPRQLYSELSQLTRFVARQTGTLTGLKRMRAESVRTLQERGYTFVNAGNFNEFGEYWREVRAIIGDRREGSDVMVEMYNQYVLEEGRGYIEAGMLVGQAVRLNIDLLTIAADFDAWRKRGKYQALASMETLPGVNHRLSDYTDRRGQRGQGR